MALGCKINERIFTFEGKDYSYDEFRALMYDGLLERIPELTAEAKETLATEEGKADVEQGLSLDEARRRLMEMREEREEGDKLKGLRKALIDVVGRMTEERAKKMARLIAPKLTIVRHSTAESLRAAHPQKENVNGFYDRVKQVIHVGPNGNATHIIAHEVLHPIFDAFIGADEAKAARLYDELVKDERLAIFARFGKNYLNKKDPSDTIGIQKSKEEAIVDYLGAVGDGKYDKELLGDSKLMQALKEMLYRIMELFGAKRPVVDITDAQTLKDLAKAIAIASRYSRAVAYTEPTIGEVSEEVDEMRADEERWMLGDPKSKLTPKEKEWYDWAIEGAKDALWDESFLQDNPDALTIQGQIDDMLYRLEEQAESVAETDAPTDQALAARIRSVRSLVEKLKTEGYFNSSYHSRVYEMRADEDFSRKKSSKTHVGTIPLERPVSTGKLNTDKALKALEDFGVKIIAPKNEQEYQQAIKQFPDGVKSSWGLYDHATRTIYINPNGPDLRNTLFHESAHPVLAALFHNNSALRDKFFDEIADEKIPGSDITYRQYGDKYADKGIALRREEAIAQFTADVIDGKVKVSTKPDSLWQRFKAFIQDIMAAMGWDTRSIDLSKPDNVREFAAQFKKAMDKGIRITGLTPVDGTTLSLQDDADRLVGGWYSRLDQAVAAKGNTQSGADWMKWAEARAKEGLLSMEEVKWTGLADFLQGKAKVTPKEVREFLKENRVKVEVKVKTEMSEEEFGEALNSLGYRQEQDAGGDMLLFDNKTNEQVDYKDLPKSAQDLIDQAIGSTSYEKHQLPGGTNYREVLVTLPSNAPVHPGHAEIERLLPEMQAARRAGDYDRANQIDARIMQLGRDIEAAGARNSTGQENLFRSSHFDEPNILVHLRLNDRIGPNGEKILFIEELQSDWGQEGKKKGFAFGAGRRDSILSEIRAIESKYPGVDFDSLAPQVSADDLAKYERLMQELGEINFIGPAITPAPFVTSSDAWVELGIKQAIRMAVDGGYDRIAWTTGEQQYDRWGSQVFSWTKRGDNWYVLGQEQAGGDVFAGMEEQLSEQAFSEGRQVESRDDLRELVLATMGREKMDWSPENWEKHIDKITDGIWQQMKDGKDGSTMPRREGMKGFYDKILPAAAKKVSKRLGGDGVVSEALIDDVRKSEAPATYNQEDGYQPGDDVEFVAGKMPQQSISIAPAMRERVGLGVPLMQRPTDEGRVVPRDEYKKALDAAFKVIEESSERAWASLSRSEQATRMADAAVAAMKKSDWFKGQDIKQQRAAIKELRGEIADRLGVELAPKTEKQQQRAEEAAFKLGQKLAKQEEAERNRQLMSDFAEFMAERIAKTKEEKAALEEKWAAKFGKYKEEAKAIIKEQKAQLAQAAKNIKNAMAQANRAVATAIVGIESAREAGIDEGLAIAAKDQKMIAAAVIATINQAKMDGKLSLRQARMLVAAAAKVNYANLKSLQRFMDLVDKVTKDVAYATRISKIRKMRKQAVANAPASEKARVREFASVNPRRMDDALLDKYQEALADLNLKVPRFAKMNAIFDDVLATKPAPKGLDPKKTEEKMLKMEEDILNASITSFDDYKGLVKMINAARNLAGKALSAGLIDNAQYDAFIDSIAGTQEKFEKKYAKQIDAVKAALTQQIISSRGGIDLNQYNGDKKELVLDLQNLKESQLSSLSLADLDMLADLVSAMVDEGSMDTMMLSSIVGRAEMAGQADRVAQQINAAKPPRDRWGKMWKDAIKKNVDRAQIAFWEGKLGLSKLVAGATEMFIISRVKGASTLSDIFIGRGHEKFIKLLEKYELNKSKKERAMHKLGMIVTYLQEYALGEESGNPDHGNRDWFKDLSGYKTQITDKNLELLREIWDSLPKDQNGNVSPKAVYDSFISGSTKFMTKDELGFLREIMDWKEENIAPKQEFANELRGQTFKRIRFHMPRMRLGENSGVPAINFAVTNNGRKISIESSTGKERVDNTVGPIETNFERMFNYNLDRTSVQYFYSKSLQQVNHLLGDLVSKLNESHKPYADAIRRIIADGIEREFQVTKKQKLDRFVGRILSAANIQILFRPDRVVQEFLSALAIYPGRVGSFRKGYNQIAKSLVSWTKSNDYVLDVMNISNSSLMLKKEGFNRVYEYKKGGYEKKGKFEQLAIQSASLPEIALAAPMWWVRFSEAFERETGVKFSIADFKADSDGYFRKYKQEFLAARAAADQAYGKIAGPTSQFGVRKEVSLFGLKDYKTSETKGMVLAWMSGFPASSWSQLSSNISTLFDLQRQAEMTGYSKGELATQAATEAFAIVIESIAYPVLTSIRIAYRPAIIAMATYAAKAAFMDDDEEEKEEKKIQKAIAEANEQVGKVMSPAAIMTNGGMAVATLPLSKYGSAGRALQGAISDVLYTAAMNNQMGLTKSDGAWIAELTNETIYRKPVDLSELRGPSMLFEYSGRATATILPPLNTMIMEYEKQRKTYGPAEKIIERMLKNEEISVGEKEFVAMGILIYNAVNVLGMTVTNTTLPFSSDLNKGARELMKGGSSAPMLQQMDGFLSNPTTFYNQ